MESKEASVDDFLGGGMLYAEHRQKWMGCEACELHVGRTKIVLAKGTVPCDLLFVGEAPGRSEDFSGIPFDGPAGSILDRMTARAFANLPPFTVAYCNLVCCIPLGEDGNKTDEPAPEHITACSGRLVEFIQEVAQPKVIVCVGQLAEYNLDPKYAGSIWVPAEHRGIRKSAQLNLRHRGHTIPRVEITHPAGIGRMNVAQRGLIVQKCVVTLRSAVEDYVFTANGVASLQ